MIDLRFRRLLSDSKLTQMSHFPSLAMITRPFARALYILSARRYTTERPEDLPFVSVVDILYKRLLLDYLSEPA